MNPVKKLSHCYCHTITEERRAGLFERLLMKLVPHFDIVKTVDGETVLYLRRFYFWRSKWIGKNFGELYLHHIVRSDDDRDPHDHPWSFLTFVLRGGYKDEIWFWEKPNKRSKKGRRIGPLYKKIKAGRLIHRRAEHTHRVRLPEGQDAWTFVLTDGYKRDWQFITKDGPVLWREYLGIWDEYGD